MANQGKRRDDEDGEHESNGERRVCIYLVGHSASTFLTQTVRQLIVTPRTVLLDRRLVMMN